MFTPFISQTLLYRFVSFVDDFWLVVAVACSSKDVATMGRRLLVRALSGNDTSDDDSDESDADDK